MEKDVYHVVKQEVALNSQSITADTNGIIIDTFNFEGMVFIVQSGSLNAGTFTWTLQDGDQSNLSDAAQVSSELIHTSTSGGSTIAFAATEDNVAKRIGYIGKRRYVRLSCTAASASGTNTFSAVAMLAKPKSAPTEA